MRPLPPTYGEPYRPLLHFSPAKFWMNDPNGLYFHRGTYHLFYQHNPHDRVWSTMSWGHASSTDLINWKHHEIALNGSHDDLGFCFSGSAVVDHENDSGLGRQDEPAILLFFTQHSLYEVQVQSLAYSNDGGLSWERYTDNPILASDTRDFRDPKIIRDSENDCWIMLVAAGDHLKFYESINLLEWHHISEFRHPFCSETGSWECPDLLQVPDEDGFVKWVLLISVDSGAPGGGSGTAYFVGEFLDKEFTTEQSVPKWIDHGSDNYASVSWWDGIEENRPVVIGWMSNWRYAAHLPTKPWRGAMTLPRTMSLRTIGCSKELVHQPVRQFDALVAQSRYCTAASLRSVKDALSLADSESWDIELMIEAEVQLSKKVELVFQHERGGLTLLLDFEKLIVSVDRSQSAEQIEHLDAFTAQVTAPIYLCGSGRFALRIVYDRSSIEVFQPYAGPAVTMLFLNSTRLKNLVARDVGPGIVVNARAKAIGTVVPFAISKETNVLESVQC